MEYILTQDLIIDEREVVESRFLSIKGFDISFDKVKEFLLSELETKIFYFNNNLCARQKNDKDVLFAWIDTGYVTDKNEAIFISLVKRADYFSGHFIGTGKYLVNRICEKNPYFIKSIRENHKKFTEKYSKIINKRSRREYESNFGIENCEVKVQPVEEVTSVERSSSSIERREEFYKRYTDVTEEIYESLLFPTWNSINGLDTYLKVVGRRISQLVEQNETSYFVQNDIKSVVANTGLMDIYGNDILVVYKYHMNKAYYVASRVINSKSDYSEEGFTREQSCQKIKPIKFFDKGAEYFEASLDDFDINTKSLRHIVEERVDRFPDCLKKESTEQIALAVMNSIEQGLKIQERDNSYARAIYSDGKISWLMPLRVNASFTEDPELVLVIRKIGEFYEVKTILPYDDETKDKITALTLYRKLW